MKRTSKQKTVVEKEEIQGSPKEPKTKKAKVVEVTTPEPVIKRQPIFNLQLTLFELVHLRDLMGILLPPDGSQTISQALAVSEDRVLIESMLWEKMTKLCAEAKLPLDAEAPDYIVAPIAPPPMGVFQISHDPNEQPVGNSGFLPEEQEDDEEGE